MGTYLSDVGMFTQAYTLQKQYESFYNYGENKSGNADSLDYANCKAFEEANDDGSYTYVKLGCSSAGGLKLLTYSDSSCTTEVSANLGLYNDAKVREFLLYLLEMTYVCSYSSAHKSFSFVCNKF